MQEVFVLIAPFLPIIIVICGLDFICYRIALNQLDTRVYLSYFNRETWIVIILVTNVIGLLLFFFLEGQQSPRI